MKINTRLVSIIKKSFVIHRKAKYCINILLISQTIQSLWGTDQSKEKEVTKNTTSCNVYIIFNFQESL